MGTGTASSLALRQRGGGRPRPYVLLLLLCALPCAAQDRDGDGLTDFQEVHKYRTDPDRADSDGDGTPDGDWSERREFTYTVRSIVQVMPPVSREALCDAQQDGRVLEERDDCVELEVVHYPLNTSEEAIGQRRGWRAASAAAPELQPFLRPGTTSNWTPELRTALVAELGVDLDALTDRELVQRAAQHLMRRAANAPGFTVYSIVFEEGRARIAAGHEAYVEKELKTAGRALPEQLQREVFGAGMFRAKTYGNCTSTAIYLQTGLRALGVPTRTIVCLPAVDASDPREVRMVQRLRHHRVRATLARSTRQRGQSWASHTFNEVYVGGRWHRLNYARLGQPILDPVYLGLQTKVLTFADHAQAGLQTWGLRYARQTRDDVFGFGNPYSCVSLSDRFGEHATVENPAPELRITGLSWYRDSGLNSPNVRDLETAGHLLVHTAAPGVPPGLLLDDLGKRFVLRAEGHPDVPATSTVGWWATEDGYRFYLRIEPADYARMVAGVPYALIPPPPTERASWVLRTRPQIVRPQ